MKWLQANLAWILSLAAVAWLGYALVRALVISARTRQLPSPVEDFSQGEKVRRDIRRKIADRKANPEAVPRPPLKTGPGDAQRGMRPIDPFGGPARGWWTRLRGWLRRER